MTTNTQRVNFELKYGFIHLLPTFNGLAGEDPHTSQEVPYGLCWHEIEWS